MNDLFPDLPQTRDPLEDARSRVERAQAEYAKWEDANEELNIGTPDAVIREVQESHKALRELELRILCKEH